jgi:DNA-binding NarL/FixJ family response regulator
MEVLSTTAAVKNAPPQSRTSAPSVENLGLTARQIDVLRLIARGESNKVMCRELGLAERTVKGHITAVFRALKVTEQDTGCHRGIEAGFDGFRANAP